MWKKHYVYNFLLPRKSGNRLVLHILRLPKEKDTTLQHAACLKMRLKPLAGIRPGKLVCASSTVPGRVWWTKYSNTLCQQQAKQS